MKESSSCKRTWTRTHPEVVDVQGTSVELGPSGGSSVEPPIDGGTVRGDCPARREGNLERRSEQPARVLTNLDERRRRGSKGVVDGRSE